MAKLGTIQFDNGILDAARNGTLVVFAGAGVSMGPPSNLPSFEELAAYIADGTGSPVQKPFDRFLGNLALDHVPVHKKAAERLSVPESRPKPLHHDLLKIFGSVDRVKIVTTNFDTHFESASIEVFGQLPVLYQAPALPRGSDFDGIVHVHGALSRPADLVLTDADFGRAYLTEGWARRFLVDLFRRYTVLFVGYSHDDVVMHYLARALPAGGMAGRYALTNEEGSWKALGIAPVRFELVKDGNPYAHLEDGVHKFAELASRGVLDWQQLLTELGRVAPPVDDQAVDEVEQALREVHTTRFLLHAARGEEWLRWLDARHHFDALFVSGDLSERDMLLMAWIIDHFTLTQPDELFELIALHGGRLNGRFWAAIVSRVGLEQETNLASKVLGRWVAILLAGRPEEVEPSNVVWLAQKCARAGEPALVLKIFLYLCRHKTVLVGSDRIPAETDAQPRRLDAHCELGCDVYLLSELWADYVKPHMSAYAYPLLTAVTTALQEIHRDLATWDMIAEQWDPHSYHRSAIEPHEQDRYPEPIDVLVDVARDALEHLAPSSPQLVDAWLETVDMAVPLLRRLAVHASTVETRMSADDRLQWILHRVQLAGIMEHHEVYRAVALSYPLANDDMRKAVVDAVLAIELDAAMDWSAQKMTDWAHFAWLSWLLQARPDCVYAREAFGPLKQRHPDWEPSEHPDFTHYSGTTRVVGHESPWPTEQLLASAAGDRLDELLNYEGTRFFGPSRAGMLMAVTAACKQQPQWAFGLMAALASRTDYKSDLWRAGLEGLRESGIAVGGWRELLAIVARAELHETHGAAIANLLYTLVRDGGKPFATELIDQANIVAFATWQALQSAEVGQEVRDWRSEAINRPAGVIVEYWLASLAVLMHGKAGEDRHLPAAYKNWFMSVLAEPGTKGGYGRVLLASQATFLNGLDDVWTRNQIFVLFTDPDTYRFTQAWHGFLTSGQLNQALATAMLPAYGSALSRIGEDARRRRSVIELGAALAVFYADEPMQNVLPALIQTGSSNDRAAFAASIGNFLRTMEAPAKQALWQRWLKHYWKLRQDGIGAAFDDRETVRMLEWLPHLDCLFDEAVALAVLAPPVMLGQNNLLLALRKSELVVQFPEAAAQLLIYLCKRVRDYQAADLAAIAHRLPALPAELDQRLRAGLARAGAL